MFGTNRMVLGVGVLAVGAVALSGCSGSAGPGTMGTAGSPQPVPALDAPATRNPATATATASAAKGCLAADVSAALTHRMNAQDPDHTVQVTVVITNNSRSACTVRGESAVDLRTGGDGSTLPIKQITNADADQTPGLVRLEPGSKATMSMDWDFGGSGCLEGASYAFITLPGKTVSDVEQGRDLGPTSMIETSRDDRLPPICGPVTVSVWSPA